MIVQFVDILSRSSLITGFSPKTLSSYVFGTKALAILGNWIFFPMFLSPLLMKQLKLLHKSNEESPIDVILNGMLIDINDEHPSNAYDLIEVTLDGMLIVVKNEHQKKRYGIDEISSLVLTVVIDS